MSRPLGVGVVGCGVISQSYLTHLPRYPGVRLVAVTDLVPERAAVAAARHGIGAASDLEALLGRDDVDVVCNLTLPQAHAEVTQRCVEAGKHVYGEKPLATSALEAAPMLAEARASSLLVGCAPDTFLGPAHQLSRRLLDEGRIGEPVAATASWLSRGHESWHPDADYYYRSGAGPLFDMGPYYLTALVNLLGPISRVSAVTSAAWTKRTLEVGPRAGQTCPVEVPTHVSGLLQFAGGAAATVHLSFDISSDLPPRLEVYGTEGTLFCPDPNQFDGDVALYAAGERTDFEAGRTGDQRGIGLADLADAVSTGRQPRAGAALALHVLEVMDALHQAGDDQRVVEIASRVERPALLSPDESWLAT
ncbi:MAG: hypothetical protein QOK42_2840 [Frankiaceae bacterium]|nr:hypothetical protein [Frankiaceae bacterium]